MTQSLDQPTNQQVQTANEPGLVRGMGLLHSISVNMLQMLGIGPFITMGIILSAMGGPQALLGWLMGAFVSVCDGLSCAELAAALPGAGGPYLYLREAYNRDTWGRLLSFLFIFQTMLVAPLSISAACVGFADYVQYAVPHLTGTEVSLTAAAACIFVTFLLFRPIATIGKLTVIILTIVIGAMLWVIAAGILNMHFRMAFDFPPGAFHLSTGFFFGMASATLFALYNYGGYNTITYLAGEVRNPTRNIPRAIVFSILAVAVFYVGMSVAIIGVIPWQKAELSHSIVSDFIGKLYGHGAGNVMTVLILIAALGSIFMMMLGYSRVLYASGEEGTFLKAFGRLHPKGRFPTVALVVLCGLSIPLCWFSIEKLIAAMMVIQIIFQFIPRNLAVFAIRRYRKDIHLPFRMWLYPWPVVIATLGWIYAAATPSQRGYFVWAGVLLVLGVATYLLRSRSTGEWPFRTQD
ncbi:MAG: APC family permease [Acidobacteriota bacterium]